MMKCSKCGAELSDDTQFCSYCGNKIEAVTPSPIKETKEDSIPDDAQPEDMDAYEDLEKKIMEKYDLKEPFIWT